MAELILHQAPSRNTSGAAPLGLEPNPRCATAAELIRADQRHRQEARQASTLEPEAAILLPFMLALARLQARRDFPQAPR